MEGFGTRWLQKAQASAASANWTVRQQQEAVQTAKTIDDAEEARALRAARRHEEDNAAFVRSSMEFGNRAIEDALNLGTELDLDTVSAADAAKRLEHLDKGLDSLRQRREQVAKAEAHVQMIRDDPHAHQERLAKKYPLLADTRVQRGLKGE